MDQRMLWSIRRDFVCTAVVVVVVEGFVLAAAAAVEVEYSTDLLIVELNQLSPLHEVEVRIEWIAGQSQLLPEA